jgi:hypothetical protein
VAVSELFHPIVAAHYEPFRNQESKPGSKFASPENE